jgi:hypothetical protein
LSGDISGKIVNFLALYLEIGPKWRSDAWFVSKGVSVKSFFIKILVNYPPPRIFPELIFRPGKLRESPCRILFPDPHLLYRASLNSGLPGIRPGSRPFIVYPLWTDRPHRCGRHIYAHKRETPKTAFRGKIRRLRGAQKCEDRIPRTGKTFNVFTPSF